jgi:hypothetical protein
MVSQYQTGPENFPYRKKLPYKSLRVSLGTISDLMLVS